MSLEFGGKTVLVVGGSSGIGNAIAQAFRRHGAKVHVWGTRPSAEDYAGEEGSDLDGLIYRQVDVADAAAIESADTDLAELDVLVQSQGIALYKRREYQVPDFRHVLDVNLTSLIACANRFHDALAASNGSIIIVSSTAAYHSTRGNPAYNASKAGAVGLTRTLGEAWIGDGIRVNGIAPGFVRTKLTRVTTDDPAKREVALKRIPIGRFGTPEEIASVALFLASPLASYVVGQTICVDGGLLLL